MQSLWRDAGPPERLVAATDLGVYEYEFPAPAPPTTTTTPAVPRTSRTLVLRRQRTPPGAVGKLRARAGGAFSLRRRVGLSAPGLGAGDPRAGDVGVQLRGPAQEILCASVPRGLWKGRHRFSFSASANDGASGLSRGTTVRGTLAGAAPGPLVVTVHADRRCASQAVDPTRRGRTALVVR